MEYSKATFTATLECKTRKSRKLTPVKQQYVIQIHWRKLYRLSRPGLWSTKGCPKHEFKPHNHIMMEASKSVCTDLRDWKLSIFDDWAAYFCIFKDLALYITSSNKSLCNMKYSAETSKNNLNFLKIWSQEKAELPLAGRSLNNILNEVSSEIKSGSGLALYSPKDVVTFLILQKHQGILLPLSGKATENGDQTISRLQLYTWYCPASILWVADKIVTKFNCVWNHRLQKSFNEMTADSSCLTGVLTVFMSLPPIYGILNLGLAGNLEVLINNLLELLAMCLSVSDYCCYRNSPV
ncbi:hypothetical protein Anapl_02259 [Anas platyrhynchos]|uniref:Uncharacterized protein n=1 Tax=Anas platyrhynchos TaxID=8839 RepID=R0KFF8_ANAPL|nr:hypothetical protein Anapl_02259 [Anas platyrhynchos]